jgi:hypothetical protein
MVPGSQILGLSGDGKVARMGRKFKGSPARSPRFGPILRRIGEVGLRAGVNRVGIIRNRKK